MVADWVVSRRPHLVFIELAINDGDTLLETEEPVSIGSALEGIVRHILDALPRCELCLLHMFIRDDLPLHLRTGSKAWAENEDKSAAATYHERVPRLHNRVAAAYGVPSVTLCPVMARLPQVRHVGPTALACSPPLALLLPRSSSRAPPPAHRRELPTSLARSLPPSLSALFSL